MEIFFFFTLPVVFFSLSTEASGFGWAKNIIKKSAMKGHDMINCPRTSEPDVPV